MHWYITLIVNYATTANTKMKESTIKLYSKEQIIKKKKMIQYAIEIAERKKNTPSTLTSDLSRLQNIRNVRNMAMQRYFSNVNIEFMTFEGYKNEIQNVIYDMYEKKEDRICWILLSLRNIDEIWSIFISKMYYLSRRRREEKMDSWLLYS